MNRYDAVIIGVYRTDTVLARSKQDNEADPIRGLEPCLEEQGEEYNRLWCYAIKYLKGGDYSKCVESCLWRKHLGPRASTRGSGGEEVSNLQDEEKTERSRW